jgi:hypothetical protein
MPNLQTLALTHPGLYFVAILNVLYYNVSKYTDRNKISTWNKFIALDMKINCSFLSFPYIRFSEIKSCFVAARSITQ